MSCLAFISASLVTNLRFSAWMRSTSRLRSAKFEFGIVFSFDAFLDSVLVKTLLPNSAFAGFLPTLCAA